MNTITTVAEMQVWSDAAGKRGRRIGLVPTMGYLHDGHLSLVAESRRRSDVTVASIFVNPLQFGANEDLDRYPRDVPRDTALLAAAGTNVLFLPNVSDIYPEGAQTTVTVERLTRGLCGAGRPVHFRGVATVVAKLFNIVKPQVAVFGRKDYQQYVVIRQMAADLNFDIEIIGAPIVRETDGIAMSSRNAYLSTEERRAALCVSRALHTAATLVDSGETRGAVVLSGVQRVIAEERMVRLEYATLADPDTLEEITTIEAATLLALAVYVGKTRLIDNCILQSGKPQAASRKPEPSRPQALKPPSPFSKS